MRAAAPIHSYPAAIAAIALLSKPSYQNGEECGTLCKQPLPIPGCPLTYLIILLSYNFMTKHTRYSINQLIILGFA